MSSRKLLTAAVLTVAVLGLVGCDPDDSAVDGAAPGSSEPAPHGSSSGAPDTDPGVHCTTPALAAGHKVVQPVEHPRQDTMSAKETRFACDPNDGHWEGVGSPVSYHFAREVKAQLSSNGAGYESVVVGELWNHIGDCLDGGADVKPPLSCSAHGVYDIKQDSNGDITEIREIWHP